MGTLKKNCLNSCLISAAAVLFFIAYRQTFAWLYARFTAADSYYSHGFLVPAVCAFLIWQKRVSLRGIEWRGNFFGLALAVFALVIHFFSQLLNVHFLSSFTLLPFVFGVSLYLAGSKVTGKIIFPLSFLAFMLPLPLSAINALSFPLKMFVTKNTVFLLSKFTGSPFIHQGFQILFPGGSMTVENPCSGLRSIIVMLALGSVFAYKLPAAPLKRAACVVAAVPAAVFSNVARVFLTGLAVFIYGPQMAEGVFHDLAGYFAFGISFFILYSLWSRLR